jgi:2,3-bisphosphoglycerate-dependent phosphoglycerate mutase
MTAFLKLLFIRHAQSTGNVERRMQGQGAYPLTDHGQAQTRKLAARLRSENWVPTAVYTSPLRRTVETTHILLDAFPTHATPGVVGDLTDVDQPLTPVTQPIPIHYEPDLAEFQNGIFQGLTWAEAQAQHPELCHQLETAAEWIPIPGAETLHMARDRAQQILSKILTSHQNGEQIWVVSHSWFMQHLISALMGSDRAWRMRIHNTALFEFWIDQSRWQWQDENRLNTDLWQIVRFNDDQHLH